MEKKLEECSDKSTADKTSSDVATCNQEVPEAMKSQMAEQSDARKACRTPSSVHLPRVDLLDAKMPDASLLTNDNTCKAPDASVSPSDNASRMPADQQAADKAAETTVKDDQGRAVRERGTDGKPDTVIAYDDKGEPHKFVNEPIKKMPPDFDQIPDWRKEQLQKQSDEILQKYMETHNPYDNEKKLDFEKVAAMQKEIAQRQDLTETEKCQLYTDIQTTMRETPIKVENWNEKPEMVDSWTGESDPWHAIAPMDDKYHNRLVNMTPDEATRTIREQEDHLEGDMHAHWYQQWAWKAMRGIKGVNEGDVNASEGQLKCMREMRDKGTFAAYADEWEKQYVQKGHMSPRDGASSVA